LHSKHGDLITWGQIFTCYLEQINKSGGGAKKFCKNHYLHERDFQNAGAIYRDFIKKYERKDEMMICTSKEAHADIIKNFLPGYFTQVRVFYSDFMTISFDLNS
jgi:hypothetical protein